MRRRFSIEEFLNSRGIPYIDHGVNVKRGEINIKCPYCIDDPSMHLGVDDQRLLFSCWRNSKHRGRLHKLIMLLARCSFTKACEILGQNALWFDKGEFETFMADPSAFFDRPHETQMLKLDLTFKEFSKKIDRKFSDYLVDRGFLTKHLEDLFLYYDLRFCNEGRYRNRIIVPVYLRDELITFTGRAIDDGIRYLTLSEKDGAVDSIKETLLNFDCAEGDVLFVCEGPFDALKVDFYGKKVGGRATCLFGKNIKPSQTLLLDELSERFKKIVLLLDSTEFETSMSIQRKLSFIKTPVEVGQLPSGISDPGELNVLQVKRLVKEYA